MSNDFDACRFDFRIDTKKGLTPSRRKRSETQGAAVNAQYVGLSANCKTFYTCKLCGCLLHSRQELIAHKLEHKNNVRKRASAAVHRRTTWWTDKEEKKTTEIQPEVTQSVGAQTLVLTPVSPGEFSHLFVTAADAKTCLTDRLHCAASRNFTALPIGGRESTTNEVDVTTDCQTSPTPIGSSVSSSFLTSPSLPGYLGVDVALLRDAVVSTIADFEIGQKVDLTRHDQQLSLSTDLPMPDVRSFADVELQAGNNVDYRSQQVTEQNEILHFADDTFMPIHQYPDYQRSVASDSKRNPERRHCFTLSAQSPIASNRSAMPMPLFCGETRSPGHGNETFSLETALPHAINYSTKNKTSNCDNIGSNNENDSESNHKTLFSNRGYNGDEDGQFLVSTMANHYNKVSGGELGLENAGASNKSTDGEFQVSLQTDRTVCPTASLLERRKKKSAELNRTVERLWKNKLGNCSSDVIDLTASDDVTCKPACQVSNTDQGWSFAENDDRQTIQHIDVQHQLFQDYYNAQSLNSHANIRTRKISLAALGDMPNNGVPILVNKDMFENVEFSRKQSPSEATQCSFSDENSNELVGLLAGHSTSVQRQSSRAVRYEGDLAMKSLKEDGEVMAVEEEVGRTRSSVPVNLAEHRDDGGEARLLLRRVVAAPGEHPQFYTSLMRLQPTRPKPLTRRRQSRKLSKQVFNLSPGDVQSEDVQPADEADVQQWSQTDGQSPTTISRVAQTCHVCGFTAASNSELLSHALGTHGREMGELRAHVCMTCGRGYSSKTSLVHHMTTRHTMTSNQARHRTVRRRPRLHRSKAEGFAKYKRDVSTAVNGLRLRSVSACDTKTTEAVVRGSVQNILDKFGLEEQLGSTADGATGGGILSTTRVTCDFPGCHRTFREVKHLKVHRMQHTDERPLACNLCSYSCRQRNSLNWHMKSRHGLSKLVTDDGRTIYI